MNQSDILELISLLQESKKLESWSAVDDAIDFLLEFTEDDKLIKEED